MLTVILWIVGSLAALFILYLIVMTIATIVTGARGRAPEGVEVEVRAPETCRVGDQVAVEVHVRDTLGRERRLNSVDLEKSFVGGFKIESVTPQPVSGTPEGLMGTYVHKFKETIPANGTTTVRFGLKCVNAGDFAGPVGVYVDSGSMRWSETPVRIVVAAG